MTDQPPTQTIHKYPLELADRQQVQMPAGATLLTAQVQYGQPTLWALVNPANPPECRAIRIVGTGNPAAGTYIATVQMHDGRVVWHLFEEDR